MQENLSYVKVNTVSDHIPLRKKSTSDVDCGYYPAGLIHGDSYIKKKGDQYYNYLQVRQGTCLSSTFECIKPCPPHAKYNTP